MHQEHAILHQHGGINQQADQLQHLCKRKKSLVSEESSSGESDNSTDDEGMEGLEAHPFDKSFEKDSLL